MSTHMICADDFLAADQPLHIQLNEAAALRGRISSIEPNILAVQMQPLWNEPAPATPAIGKDLQVSIPGKQCAYRFTSTYQHKHVVDDLIWYIAKPKLIEKQQLRRFIRVPASLPMRVRLPNSLGGFRNTRSTVTIDISGGGLCFVSKDPAPPESQIRLSVAGLPQLGELSSTAEVVRCTRVHVPAGIIYHIGVSLEKSLPVRTQDKLIHSIFCLQRKHLSSGLA